MRKNERTCGNCYWRGKANDRHYICTDGDLKIRVKKNDKFGKICDNWEQNM